MKLLLVNLYPRSTIARYMVSSYALKAYLDARKEVHVPVECQVVNLRADSSVDSVVQSVRRSSADVVGFSCYAWNSSKVRQVLAVLDDDVGHPRWILGGPEISHDSLDELTDCAQEFFCVVGEGEAKLAALIDWMAEGKTEPSVLPGGTARISRGEVTCSTLPEEPFDLADNPSVFESNAIEDRLYARQQAFVETQRGCKCRCSYCVYPKFLPRVRFRPLDKAIEELRYLIIEKRVAALRFLDADFLADVPRAKAIVRSMLEIAREGTALPWIYWEFSPGSADEEFLALCGQLSTRGDRPNTLVKDWADRPQHYSDLLEGYTAINCVGIQSLNRESLKAVHRPFISGDALGDLLSIAENLGIVFKLDFILGLPHETFQSYFDGMDRILPLLENTDHVLNIHLLQMLPGSILAREEGEFGISYEAQAPHYVTSTSSFSERELARALLVSTFIFRIINTPLRRLYFEAQRQLRYSVLDFFEHVAEEYVNEQEFVETPVQTGVGINDDYWNQEAFSDIPSEWIVQTISAMTVGGSIK